MLSLMCFAAMCLPIVILLLAAAISRRTKYFKPKNFGRTPVTNESCPKPRDAFRDCSRDPFREKKLPPNIDYVIIGSGMGSMYCAALLSKAGKRVVILEQHYVAGGCTHSFYDSGFEFDTGLHYVGRMEKYKKLLDLVTGRGAKRVEWAKMGSESDGFCYDEIKLGGEAPFCFRAGEKRFVDDLARDFPSERAAIEEYVRLCARVNKLADMYFYGKL